MERKTDGERAKRRIADAGRQRARATAAVPRKPHGGDPPSLCHPGAKNLGNRGSALPAGPGRASIVRAAAGLLRELDASQQEIPGTNLSTQSLLKLLFIYFNFPLFRDQTEGGGETETETETERERERDRQTERKKEGKDK